MADQQKKMPNTDQRHWEQEIKRARDRRRKWEDFFRVEECYKYYLGDQKPENYVEEDWFTLNITFANVRAQLPSLYYQNPYIYMNMKRSYDPNPQTWELHKQLISIRENMINYLKDEKAKDGNLKFKVRLAILDSYFRFGVLKARYIPEMEENQRAGQKMMAKDGENYLKDPDTGEDMVEPEQSLVGEKFVWERINPRDFLVNADAGVEQFSWCGHVTPMDEDLCNKLYPNAGGRISGTVLRSDYREMEADQAEGFLAKITRRSEKRKIEDADAKDKLVLLWEIYDLVRNKKWCIAEGHHKPVSEMETPKGVEYHPFAFLRLNDNPGDDGAECWYPIPEIYNTLGPQKEYNLARNDIAIHRKRFKRMYGYLKGSIEDEELSKFEDPYDGGVIGFEDPNWQSTFAPIQDAGLNEAVKIDAVRMRSDFDDVMGSTPSQLGSPTGVSATEVALNEKHLQIRESDKQGQIREFVIDAARKMTMLLEDNLTTSGAILVNGPNGQVWQTYKESDFKRIRAEVVYDIDVTQMSNRDDAVQRAQWGQFMASAMQVPMIFEDPDVLIWWAEKYDIHDKAMLMKMAQGFKRMREMAQEQQGVLQNTPGQRPGPTSLGNLFSAQGGAKGGG